MSPPEKGGGGPRQTPNTTPHQGDRHRKDQVSGDGNPVTELLDSFIGLEVDGGCDDCNAYQTIERLSVGVYVNHIHHDDTCPWWIRYQAATR